MTIGRWLSISAAARRQLSESAKAAYGVTAALSNGRRVTLSSWRQLENGEKYENGDRSGAIGGGSIIVIWRRK
jgi:hypothetical protein